MIAQNPLMAFQAEIHAEARRLARPVPQLMTRLLERRNLQGAWDRVRATNGSNTPGIDGDTCDALESQLERWLDRLADDLLHGRYQPQPPRRVDIPKNSGTGIRRIGILTIRDRVVHAALKQVLEPVLEPVFLSNSFGFRPGRSVAAALNAASRAAVSDEAESLMLPWAAHLDVADCFDTIDHQLLTETLACHVADSDLHALLRRTLQTGGTRAGLVRRRWRGIVQGSALSPLLCNLYLHPLDEVLSRFRRQSDADVQMFRYADDLLILAPTARLCRNAIDLVRRTLRHRRQRLRRPVAAPSLLSEGVSWLGVSLAPRRNSWTGRIAVGYLIRDDKVRSMLARIDEMTVPPSERIDPAAFNLARWLVSINDQLRDWRQVYQYADNAREVFATLDERALRRVGQLLESVTGLRRYQLVKQYVRRLPRGFWTWEVEGTRLVVLSSLAPRRPYRLVRPPNWIASRGRRPLTARRGFEAARAGKSQISN